MYLFLYLEIHITFADFWIFFLNVNACKYFIFRQISHTFDTIVHV